jgi:hypothetical protein
VGHWTQLQLERLGPDAACLARAVAVLEHADPGEAAALCGLEPERAMRAAARRFTDYYLAWLDNLADDVTVEGSLLDGAVQGPEAARTIVVTIRSLYDHQEFNFAGPYGDNGWLEDYIAQVRGEPLGCVVLVTRNADGQTQHIAANYRPRSSLLLLSRLLGEKFAGTPSGEQFAASES